MSQFPNAIVVAPPATGKTTICKKYSFALDADSQPEVRKMYSELKAKYGPKWWNVPAAKATKLRLIPIAFAPIFERMTPGQMLLTTEAAAMWDAPDTFRKFVVSLTPQEYAQRLASRAKDPSQSHNWHSSSPEKQQQMLDNYHNYAVSYKATEVSSFSTIINN